MGIYKIKFLKLYYFKYLQHSLINSTRKYLSLLLLLFICNGISASSNDSILISQLLHRLDDLQIKENGIFPKGSIPSFRMYALNKTRYKADVNPFFTGLVSLTLQNLMPKLSASQQLQAKTIIDRATAVYPKFKSKKNPERNTYNFWPTDTVQIFPNGGWLNLFDKSRAIADDMDDTVILLMAQNADEATANQVHDLMQLYRNGYKYTINSTFDGYKNMAAYSTWFGKKMPIEFDFGVHANVLYFVQYYQLPWSAADSATLQLMTTIIKEKQYISLANYISPQYARPAVLLYHISRLMALKPIPQLEDLKPSLIAETEKLLLASNLFMDQVLLSTSLLRWGVQPPSISLNKSKKLPSLIEDDQFVFFLANIGSMFPNSVKNTAYKTGAFRFTYHCPGYNNLLLLENLVLQQTFHLN